MDIKEFVEALRSADEDTVKAVCQLLEVSPQPFLYQGWPLSKAHKVSRRMLVDIL